MLAPNSVIVALLLASPFTNALYLRAVNVTSPYTSSTSMAPVARRAPDFEYQAIRNIRIAARDGGAPPVTTSAGSNATTTSSTPQTGMTTTGPQPTTTLPTEPNGGTGQGPKGPLGILDRLANIAIRALDLETSTTSSTIPTPRPFLTTPIPELPTTTASISIPPVSTTSAFPQLVVRNLNGTVAGTGLKVLGKRNSNSTIVARGIDAAEPKNLGNSTVVRRKL
ncbi:hypothetical protein TWF281_006831 [Arthrobotrys megalospora]